jgi:hypothetical protein
MKRIFLALAIFTASRFAADSVYTASEKVQYSGEIDVENSKVVPITEVKK